jgi:D-alanyl-D-alanine carboxypeptidase
MEDIVTNTMNEKDVPGVIVGVWTPEGTFVEAFGEADIEKGTPMSIDDRVRIASNTKTFVATVVLQLAQEGRLSLEDRLSKFVPSVKDAENITIRQVLQMTSGTFSFTEDEQFDKDFTADPLMKLTPEQEIEIANKHDNYFPPGRGYHYSDTNYEIAGLLIEKVTGNKVEEEIRDRIIEPLGLKDTSFPETPDIAGKHSKGYVLQDGELLDYTRIEPSVPWAGGAMISNLDDMRIWAEALASGSLLGEQMRAEQMRTVKMGEGPAGYGLGVLDVNGFRGHEGAIFGFNTIFLRDPERDATFIVFTNQSTNSAGDSTAIVSALIRVVYPDMGKE